MSTPPPTTLPGEYYRSRLGRRELDGLFATASEGFQPPEIVVSHERHHRTFSAPTLNDLVAMVQAAPLPGDPDEWDNLTYEATDPAGKRSITIRLTAERVDTHVTGSDTTLVYGSDSKIRIYLEHKRIGAIDSPMSPARKQMRKSLVGVATFGVLLWYGYFWYTPAPGAAPPPLTILGLLTTVFFVLALKEWLQDRSARGCLEPTRQLPTGSLWSRLPTMEKLTAIAALVAAVAAVGTLISAGTDLFKSG
ncbi:hypothetical protein P3T27_008070 [Kitasatospora sp. MAA19]|uniref:hypothetical protein n=1 Tax=Kitasatospora sp. MAA19 TaxID=3035090 RepID=UPI002472F7AA|nr:hypothetical protein [Kitasatospora sp. MAA19]MDH6711312.1 hypothetical protein [Kitasatospora sp. MAA19]